MKNQKGQTLIEVLVALATAVVVISAITVATISSLNNAEYGRNQNMATQYSQQGMEILRNMRNTNWQTFSNLGSEYCLGKECTSIDSSHNNISNLLRYCWTTPSQGCNQNVDIFSRSVIMEQNASSCGGLGTKVTVTTAWFDGKCGEGNLFCHKVQLSSCMSDYTALPTP